MIPFPPPYDFVAVTKMRTEYLKDGKKQMPWPSNAYFHVFHENRSTFHSNVFNVVWWNSEWIVSGCIGILLKACRVFIKFIYNDWVCQYHYFTWSYQLKIYICINILALTHIEPMFHFWTSVVFWKLDGFLKFSGRKK